MTNQFFTVRNSFAVLALLGLFTAANADTVSVTPADSDGLVGETVDLTLGLDFTTVSLGGGIDIFVGGAGSFQSFTPGTFLLETDINDPTCGFNCFSDWGPGLKDDAAADFGVVPGDFNGFSGIIELGTITVLLESEGIVSVNIAGQTIQPFTDGLGATFEPAFEGATVNANVVPIPAAAWLFGSALVMLGGIRRRMQAA